MPGLIYGARGDSVPIIECEICAPTPNGQLADANRVGVTVRALVDIGASHVLATSAVIAAAGLVEAGSINNTTVGFGARARPWFLADVIFRGGRSLVPHIPYVYTVKGVQLIDDHLTAYDVILGWDALAGVGLQFETSGAFVMRLP